MTKGRKNSGKERQQYECAECGYLSPKWEGRCSRCGNWNTFVAVESAPSKRRKNFSRENRAERLADVTITASERLEISIGEFNRVIGGGFVKDSVTILTARPGAGKSTLLLELAKDFADGGISSLYLSGEESESQIKARAERIMTEIPKNIWILSTNSLDDGLAAVEELKPEIVFLDSIQTFELEAFEQRQGSPTQTVECVNALVETAKSGDRPIAVMMVGHVTKSDEMAGLRTLEHLVDTVLYLEGEADEELRVLMSTKNRFGPTGEIGLFRMDETGIKEIVDPSEHFVTKRREPAPGSAVAMVKEGSRLIAVEVESLVSASSTPYPVRIGDSLRKDQLNTLLSILEERAGIPLHDKNVILKTTGGLRLAEQSVNLAIIMSVVSSILRKGIDERTVFIAEVGLTGELKSVSRINQRIRELDRIGYKKVYVASGQRIDFEGLERIQVIQKTTLSEVIVDAMNWREE